MTQDASLPIMKDIVDVFTFGLKQIDGATAFEKYTTALEMIFLVKDQQGKKEVLSKRVASLLGQNDSEILEIYENVKYIINTALNRCTKGILHISQRLN